LDSKRLTAVQSLAREMAERDGFELVELTCSPAGRRPIIRILLHRLDGPTVDECQRFSEDLSVLLEAEGAVTGGYVLEVSSSGLTRPLKTAADFRRSLGRQVEVRHASADGEMTQTVGTLEEVTPGGIRLVTAAGPTSIALADIRHAKPVIDWKQLFRAGKDRSSREGKQHE
jgi:ribosome maturation factor RimP